MQPSLTEGARLILPGEPLDAICYSCTAASVVIGDDAVAAAIRQGKPGARVVTPVDAGGRGLATLGARRISLLTPYTVETTRPMARYFASRGFELASVTCLGFEDDREMARIAPDEIVALAKDSTAADADALFISCTAVRAAPLAPAIEAAIGRPVVTSNLASAWMCLWQIGDRGRRPQWGRLMATAPAEG
jgi:maleate isomerase